MSGEYDQLLKGPDGPQDQKILDASKLEEIVIPDITQAVEKVDRKKDDDRLFVCQCGDPLCGFTVVANNLARAGHDDFYIINNVGAYRVR